MIGIWLFIYFVAIYTSEKIKYSLVSMVTSFLYNKSTFMKLYWLHESNVMCTRTV